MGAEWRASVDRLRALTPATRLVAITPHDDNNLTDEVKSLFVGTGGNLSVIAADDSSEVTLKNIPDGSIVPISAKRVKATNTTATDIVGLL